MRLLIDSTQIPLARTGVGIYAEHLIAELALISSSGDKIFVLVQSDDQSMRAIIEANSCLNPIVIPAVFFRHRATLAVYEQCILPWVALFYRVDLIHSLHYTFPLLCPCRRIVTIHDMTFFLWPQMHTRARRIVMPFFIRMALRYAEGLLFVSNSARKDAERIFGTGKNLRYVTPLGADERYFSKLSADEIEGSLVRHDIHLPYVLFVGTVEPRKNILRLIRAFESIAAQYSDLALVIAGGKGWGYKEILEAVYLSPVTDRIRRLGYVSDEDKLALTIGCSLLAYPSLYEGFGLPVLEGMAAGVPVITSNVSSLPEVAGDAAILIDPTSVEEIAAAMDFILSDETTEGRLRKAGKERARHFSWKKTAQLTYVAYRTLVTNSSGRAAKS